MADTYHGILEGDRIRWIGPRPPSGTVRVTVNTLPQPEEIGDPIAPLREIAERGGLPIDDGYGNQTADPLRAIAARGGIPSIPDPVAWQREIRRDRPLPGRED